MVDIHSHILAEQDDGARSFDESVAMVRMAAEAGTTDIVASPHANHQFVYEPEVVERKIGELQRAVSGVTIHFGCDFHLTPENIEDAIAKPEKYSINHKGYLLVEFADHMVPKGMEHIFGRMVTAGLQPIVTHPERNPVLQKKMAELEHWVQRGCWIQVTGHSLLGRFGKSAKAAAEELMGRGMVHFLASDGHDCKHRPPVLDEVRRLVVKEYGEEMAERLLEENPRAVLTGMELSLEELVIRKKSWLAKLRGR